MDSPESPQLTTDDSKHREALGNWLSKAKGQINNPLSTIRSETDILVVLANTLSACGPMRLYKYQPYSERNIQDFLSGSIHLSPLHKLNDRFEGFLHFDDEFSKHAYESISRMDKEAVRPFLSEVGAALGCEVDDQSLDAFTAFLGDGQGLSSSIDALDSGMQRLDKSHEGGPAMRVAF